MKKEWTQCYREFTQLNHMLGGQQTEKRTQQKKNYWAQNTKLDLVLKFYKINMRLE